MIDIFTEIDRQIDIKTKSFTGKFIRGGVGLEENFLLFNLLVFIFCFTKLYNYIELRD